MPSEGYKFGDATYEINKWYGDSFSFVAAKYPWFERDIRIYPTNFQGIFSSGAVLDIASGGKDSQYSTHYIIKP